MPEPAAPTQSESPWLKVSRPEVGCSLVFATPADLEEWLKKEDQFFKTQLNNSGITPPFDKARIRFREALDKIRNEYERFKLDESLLPSLRASIDGAFRDRDIFDSNSTPAHFIRHAYEKYGDKSGHAAAAVIMYAHQNEEFPEKHLQPIRSNHEFDSGVFVARLWLEQVQCGLGDRLFTAHSAEWQTKLGELARTGDTETSKLESLHSTYSTKLDELAARFTQIKAIDAPSEYWSNKRWLHLYLCGGLFAAIIIVGVFGGWCLITQILRVRVAINDLIVSQPDLNPILLLPWSLPILVGALGLFWLLRILVRVFLTQLHLWSDAGERVVMVNTYLALLTGTGTLGGQSGVRLEHLEAVLAALFRHGSTGVFPDDLTPPVPLAVLTQDSSFKPTKGG